MATTTTSSSSFQSLHQSPFLSPPQTHYFQTTPGPSPFKLSFPLSPSPSLTCTCSLLTPTTPSTSTFSTLSTHLANSDFRQADEETRRLLIALAGDPAHKRGYVFFSEVQFISAADLRAIDELWRTYSDGRFGYSVQKRIWVKKAKKDFTQFFIRVGWMRKLDTEVVQWNYRSFPDEFIWQVEEGDKFPEGHLPLTNALRGTQLLASILMHPAFEDEDEDEDEGEGVLMEAEMTKEKPKAKIGGNMPTTTTLKTDYSF